jgi:hypothetical protein
MIKVIKEFQAQGNKIYLREGLESDVIELKASYINSIVGIKKTNKYKTGDIYRSIDTGNIYEFEEGSNQWYLRDLATITSSEITEWFGIY